MKVFFLFLTFLIFIPAHAQLDDHIKYKYPVTPYYYKSNKFLDGNWFLSNSYYHQFPGFELSMTNFNPKNENSLFVNIPTWSTGLTKISYEHVPMLVFRFSHYIPSTDSLNHQEVKTSGYQFQLGAAYDLIRWKFMDLNLNLLCNFGRRTVSGELIERYKLRNPATGLTTGLDMRFNLANLFENGISLSAFGLYNFDFTKDKWLTPKNYSGETPISGKIQGFQVGLGIHVIFKSNQTYRYSSVPYF